MNAAKPKVVIIGLDGATFRNLSPWMDEGLLPNLKFLVSNGSSGELESTKPCLSPAAWTSFMTGVNPGKHGVFGFVKPFRTKRYKREIFSSHDIKAKTIFDILSDYGKTVGAISLPMTYPPFKINGFMVSCGLTTPSTDFDFTYPKDLFEKNGIKKEEYILHVTWTDYPENEKERFFSDLIKCTEVRKNISFKLMDEYDLDLFTIVFGGTDWLQHFCWHIIDPTHHKHNPEEAQRLLPLIKNYYHKIDSIIGEFINRVDENTSLFIVSDHGFGPWQKWIALQKLLEQKKFLYYINKFSLQKVIRRAKRKTQEIRGVLQQTSSIYRKMKSIIKPVAQKAKALFFKKYFKIQKAKNKFHSIVAGSLDTDYWKSIDWQKTISYTGYANDTIYLNLKGREPEGSINPGQEYLKVRNQLIEFLSNLNDPETKNKLKIKIYRNEDIYSGPYSCDGYDLCLEVEDGLYTFQNGANFSDISGKTETWTGTHKKEGIVIAYGKHFKKAYTINSAQITDIAPTALYLLGLPVVDDMDGKVLKAAFRDDYLNQTPITFAGTSKKTEKKATLNSPDGQATTSEKLEKRLADLGYL